MRAKSMSTGQREGRGEAFDALSDARGRPEHIL